MPDISSLQSPIKTPQYQQPVINHYGQAFGSADTALGRLAIPGIGSNYYDKGLLDYGNQVNTRYSNQGVVNTIGNFFADLGVKTFAGIPQVAGSILGAGKGTVAALTDGNFADGFENNTLLNAADAISAWGTEHFPTLQQEGFNDLSFVQQLHPSNLGQLVTSNVETIAFAAQSFSLAGLLSKVGVGARAVNALAKGTTFQEAILANSPQKLASIAATMDEVALNAFLTTNESALEAVDSKKTVTDKLYRERSQGLNKLTDQEIDQIADKALANTFWLNMLTSGITNQYFSKLVSPLFSPKAVASRANNLGLNIVKNSANFVDDAAVKLSPIESFLLDKGNVGGRRVTSLVEQFLSEGVEENLQYSIQKVAELTNANSTFLSAAQQYLEDVYTSGLDFSDENRLKAAGLGSLMGAGQMGFAELIGIGPGRDARSYRKAREEAKNKLNGAYTDFFSSHLVEKEDDVNGKIERKEVDGQTKYFVHNDKGTTEITPQDYEQLATIADPQGNYTIPGKVKFDNDGAPIKDKAKAAEFAAQVKYQGELDNLIDLEASKARADATKLKLYQLEKLANLAKYAFKYGVTDSLQQKLDTYKGASAEKAAELGTTPEEVGQLIDSYKDYLQKLENNFLQTNNGIIHPKYSAEDERASEALKDKAFDIGARLTTLNTLKEDIKQQLDKYPKDLGAEIQEAFSKETRDVLSKYTTDELTAPQKTEIAELAAKQKDIQEAIDSLSQEYNKLMAKDGLEYFKKNSSKPTAFQTPREGLKDLPISDETTPASLESHLAKKETELRQKNRLNIAKSEFYSDAINVLAKDTQKEEDLQSLAESLESIISKVTDQGLHLYPDEVHDLKQMVTTFTEKVNQDEADALTSIETLTGIPANEIQDFPVDELPQEILPYIDRLDNIQRIKKAGKKLFSNTQEVLDKIEDAKTMLEFNPTKENLRQQAIDELTNPLASFVDNVPQDYEDLRNVQSKKDIASHLRRLFEGLGDPQSVKAANKLAGIVQSLHEVEKVVKTNLQNKELKNQKENIFYATGTLALATNVPGVTDGVEALQTTEPVLAHMVLVDKLVEEEPQVIAEIASKLDTRLKELMNSLTIKDSVNIGGLINEELFEIIRKAPSRGIQYLFEVLYKKESATSAKNIKPLENFIKTYDVVDFEQSLKDFEGITSSEQLRELLNLYREYWSLEFVQNAKEGGFNHTNYLGGVISELKKTSADPAPSTSQLRVLSELMAFVMAPRKKSPKLFHNGAALRAPAGAGKSLVVSKYLKQLLKLTDEEILTAAPYQLAAENISRSLGTKGTNTVEDLTNQLNSGKVDKGVKIIVIDEAGALKYKALNNFAEAFAKYSSENPDHEIKFLLLYDPNQVTPGNIGKPALDASFVDTFSGVEKNYHNGDARTKNSYERGLIPASENAKLTNLPLVENLKQIAPLSTTYRAGVAEVVDLQNLFKTNNPVNTPVGSATKDPKISTTNILGTYVESGNNIVEVYTKSASENPDRSRLILVGSQDKVAAYKSKLPNAQVLTVPEAAGIAADEVYVDLAPTDAYDLATPPVFNQWMYTALSRARSFIYLTGYPTNNVVDPNIKEQRPDTAQVKQDTIKLLEEQLKTLAELTSNAPVPTPTETTEPPEEEEEVASEEPLTAEETAPEDSEPEVVLGAGVHQLEFPTNSVFEDRSDRGLSPLLPGDELIVARDTDGTRSRYLVLKRINDFESEIVGVLADTELGWFERNTGLDLATLPAHRFVKTTLGVKPEEGYIKYHTVYVQPTSNSIKFNYHTNTHTRLAETSGDNSDKIRPILTKYLDTAWEQYGLEDRNEILNNPEKYTTVMVFTTGKQVEKMFPDLKPSQRPRLGPPYLVLKGIKTVSGRPIKNQFIQLAPDILTDSNFNTQPIHEFIQKVEEFQTALQQSKLPGAYQTLQMGVPVDVAGEKYFPFHEFITKLSNVYKTKGVGKLQLTASPLLTSFFPDLDSSAIPNNVLRLAYELDVLIHGDVSEGEHRGYKGPAQTAFDAIAAQNLMVTTANGKNIVLRDYRTYERSGKEYATNGMSLLGTVKFTREKGLAYNPIIKVPLSSRLERYKASLEKRGRTDSSRYKFLDKLLTQPGNKHINPLTLEDLKDIFVRGRENGAYTKNSEGFGLRVPLPKTFNAANSPSLSDVPLDLLVSHFRSVTPTRIVVGTSPNMVTAPEVVKEVVPTSAVAVVKHLLSLREDVTEQEIEAAYPGQGIVERLLADTGANTFEEAAEAYYSNANDGRTYVTKAKNLIKQLKLNSSDPRPTTERIVNDLINSVDIVESGRNRGQYAARDFIRASIFARVFNAKTPEDLYKIADFIRTDFFSGKNYTKSEFDATLMDLAGHFFMDEAQVVEKFNEFIRIYQEIATTNAIEYSGRTVTRIGDIYYELEAITALGSVSRALIKQRAFKTPKELTSTSADVQNNYVADALPVPIKAFAEKLVAAADDTDAYELLLMQNPALAEVLGKISDNPLEAALQVVAGNEIERSQRFVTEGISLNKEQITELVNRFTGGSLLRKIKYFFSGKVPTELFEITSYTKLVNSRGENVWGLYRNGVISFAELASGNVALSTVRHELFHKIFWEYLTPGEQIQALNLARETYGEQTVEQLEERLAEEFESFVATAKPSFLENLWLKLKRLLGFTFNNLGSIENFFNKIEAGAFKVKQREFAEIERSAINIRAKFDSLAQFKAVKNLLLSTFAQIETERKTGTPRTFSEIVEATLDRLKQYHQHPELFSPSEYTLEQINELKRGLTNFLKDGKLVKNVVDTYFGQTQTRGAILKFLEEKQIEEIEALQQRLEDEDEGTDEYAFLMQEIDGLKGETYDSELIDPHLKLTGVIKQKLISIKYWKNGVENYADLNRAFSIIIQRVASIPTHSLMEALVGIRSNFASLNTNRSQPSIRFAVGKFMLEKVQSVLNGLEDNRLIKHVDFRKDATHDKIYAIYSKAGTSVESLTRSEAEASKELYDVVELTTSLDDLLKELSVKSNTPVDALKKRYFFFEDLDFIRSLVAAVSSLRKNRPLSFVESWEKGIQKVYGYLVQTGGGKRTHEANIRFHLEGYINAKLSAAADSLFSPELKQQLYKADDVKSKRDFIKIFLNTVGVKRNISEAPAHMIERTFNQLQISIPALEALYNSKEEEEKTAEDIIRDESALISELVDIINTHYTLGETHSYTRGDGKKAYGWIDASYQSDVFTSISNAFEGNAHKKFDTFSVDGKTKKISSTDRFLKDSIFVKGMNSIHSFNDFDSWRIKGSERFAKYLRKENLKDFRKRHFIGNFLSRWALTGGKYYQAMPIPSNRTTIQNVEVGVLTGEKIDNALKQIINAQKNRPKPSDYTDLAATKVYASNYSKWKFAGLEGDVNNMTTEQAIKAVKSHVNAKVEELKQAYHGSATTSPSMKIPDRLLERLARQTSVREMPIWKKDAGEAHINNYWQKRNKIVDNLLTTFYYNYIINQYALSQIVYGDETFYKSKEDQTKRIQIVTATGDTLLTDPVYGLPKESNVLVVEDIRKFIPDDLEGAIASSFRDGYDVSDAEGFMLPEFYEKIARAYGTDSLTDVILKPVYFSIENGIPMAVKYSVKVLTDELVGKFPHLKSYRDAMRDAKTDQLVFASAVKIGLPNKLATVGDDARLNGTIPKEAIIKLNNENLRFQLNPASDVEKSVSNPSQGTAMQNTNGQNTAENYELHRANAFLIESGLRGLFRSLRLTTKGTMTAASEKILRKKIISSLEGLPNGRDVIDILTASDMGKKASLDLPLIADRVISTISSMLTSATTGFRIPGSKLVLQADLTPVEVTNEDGTKEFRNLQWRDKDGYCEVILPKEYEEFYNHGDVLGLKNGLVGFRIPSTNYHSLLPMKVVGFYPAPKGSKGNVVIAPSMIVYYHGSDIICRNKTSLIAGTSLWDYQQPSLV